MKNHPIPAVLRNNKALSMRKKHYGLQHDPTCALIARCKAAAGADPVFRLNGSEGLRTMLPGATARDLADVALWVTPVSVWARRRNVSLYNPPVQSAMTEARKRRSFSPSLTLISCPAASEHQAADEAPPSIYAPSFPALLPLASGFSFYRARTKDNPNQVSIGNEKAEELKDTSM